MCVLLEDIVEEGGSTCTDEVDAREVNMDRGSLIIAFTLTYPARYDQQVVLYSWTVKVQSI